MIKEQYIQPLKFILVGIINTIVGMSVMFLSYNLLHFNYWISSALNYIVGSICSYFLNKYFTFKSEKKSFAEIIRFIIVIAVCYGISYGLARPFIYSITQNKSVVFQDNLAMVLGTVIFTVLNFIGQKFFVFKK